MRTSSALLVPFRDGRVCAGVQGLDVREGVQGVQESVQACKASELMQACKECKACNSVQECKACKTQWKLVQACKACKTWELVQAYLVEISGKAHRRTYISVWVF